MLLKNMCCFDHRDVKRSGCQAIVLELWWRELGIGVTVKNPATSRAQNVRDVCVASTLTADYLPYINGQLYCTENKVKQDAISLYYMDIQQGKWWRPKVEDGNKQSRRCQWSTSLWRQIKEGFLYARLHSSAYCASVVGNVLIYLFICQIEYVYKKGK